MVHQLTLKLLFRAVAARPGLLLRYRDTLAALTWRLSGHVRRVCTSNGRYVLGPDADDAVFTSYGRSVLSEFIRFVADIAAAQDQTREQLLGRIADIEGREHFEQAQALGKGLVIATCHCGSFEVGAAAVAARASETHVLFQGDAQCGFEAMRARLHGRLGLTEAHVERGLDAWMQLRDALGRGGAVLIQADRCMPGQPGTPTAFLHGHVEMPDGPAKLARMTGAPIVPIACLVQADGRVRLIIDKPIDPADAPPRRFDEQARNTLAAFFSRVIRKSPGQWHTLHQAFTDSTTGQVADTPS